MQWIRRVFGDPAERIWTSQSVEFDVILFHRFLTTADGDPIGSRPVIIAGALVNKVKRHDVDTIGKHPARELLDHTNIADSWHIDAVGCHRQCVGRGGFEHDIQIFTPVDILGKNPKAAA